MGGFFERRLILILLLGLPTLTVFFAAVIYTIDPVGYVSQLTAECFGSLIALIATVTLVEWYLVSRRGKQWERVKSLTVNAIGNQLCEVASDYYRSFKLNETKYVDTILNCQNVPNPETLNDYGDFVERARRLPGRANDGKPVADAAVKFYEEATWNLDQIQTILTPRVLQSTSDTKLIDALVHHDEARRQLHLAVMRYSKGLTANSVYPKVVSLLESNRDLYQVLCENGHGGKKVKKTKNGKNLKNAKRAGVNLETLKAK